MSTSYNTYSVSANVSNSQLIELEDGSIAEAELPKVNSLGLESLNGGVSYQESLKSIIMSVSKPIIEALTVTTYNGEPTVRVKQAEVEFGIKFNVEGTAILTRSTQDANFTVKLFIGK